MLLFVDYIATKQIIAQDVTACRTNKKQWSCSFASFSDSRPTPMATVLNPILLATYEIPYGTTPPRDGSRSQIFAPVGS
jgi:hypothetical protein